MDEFTKARLQLFTVSVAFALFIFCAVFGAVKIYKQINPQETSSAAAVPAVEEPTFTIPENPQETEVKKQTSALEDFDRSKTFYGLRKSWKKYRSPKCGILVDITNKKLLWSYNAGKIVPIASMSKMLTLHMAFDALKNSNGVITLNSLVKVSKNSATGREGSFGFLPGKIYSIEDLVKSSIVRSSNDGAAALAVYFGGEEKKFVEKMNIEAKKLGMKNTSFINPHGLPEKNKDNLSTMNDMLILSLRMIENPDYMHFSKMKAVKIGERTIVNTNNLMRRRKYPGIDGLKTGYTRRAGFCLAFSCLRDGRRLVGVVAGFPSAADRENFLTALLNWAYGK